LSHKVNFMNELEAKTNAEKWLRERYPQLDMVVVEVRETKHSWIFTRQGKDEPVLYGNVPIAVNKISGSITVPYGAAIEFVPANRLTLLKRIKRWWYRLYY
jgi:hypothetical protein